MIKKLFVKRLQFTFSSHLWYSGIENWDCDHLFQFRPIWVKIGPTEPLVRRGAGTIVLKENGDIDQVEITCRIHQIFMIPIILYICTFVHFIKRIPIKKRCVLYLISGGMLKSIASSGYKWKTGTSNNYKAPQKPPKKI